MTLLRFTHGFRVISTDVVSVMKNHGKLCCVAATEWVFVDLTVRRAIECPENVASCFVTVPSDDARLKELGIARCVRFAPVGLA